MFSIPHIVIIFVVVLVVFGPHKLPELARGLGKLLAEFRKASTDFKLAFEEEMRNIERQAREAEYKKAQEAAAAAAASSETQPATLATPANAETNPELPETIEPKIMPVAESVPRATEGDAEFAANGAEHSVAEKENSEAAASESAVTLEPEPPTTDPDRIHDHRQPA